tara:strand:- start:2534 stop:2662 length:129 start_codon:yes stop_codon:yes gene_type:complete
LWLSLLALPALGQQNASPAAEQKLRVAVERQAFLGCIEWLAQ